MTVYAALTVALLCASTPFVSSRFRWWFAPLLAGSLGLLMEFAQVFIPSRGASVADMVVNILGIGVGFMVYSLIRLVLRRIPVAAVSA